MDIDAYRIPAEPYYQPVGDEIAVFEAAWRHRLPVMLKGPTGCGKTRFVEHMAWRLGQPLITVAAHEDDDGRGPRRSLPAGERGHASGTTGR